MYSSIGQMCCGNNLSQIDSQKFYMRTMTREEFQPSNNDDYVLVYKGLCQSNCNCNKLTADQTLDYSNPKWWGPHLWKYLHYSSSTYPTNPSPQEIHDMVEWLKCLHVTIPCGKCKYHFKQYIEQNNDKLYDICSCRDKLFKFLVDIHNKVNKRNNKPELTYEEAKNLYVK